jgi:hypothetical protein
MIYYQTIEIYLSNNPVTAGERQEYWGDPVAVYEYYGGNPIDIDLAANSQGQYIILYFPNSASDPYMSLAELDVYGSK